MHPSSRYFDLCLGEKHWLAWIRNRDQVIIGGIIRHAKADAPKGYCEGTFDLDIPENINTGRDTWKLTGSFERPTLEPSVKCHCKTDHGFISDGRWIPD